MHINKLGCRFSWNKIVAIIIIGDLKIARNYDEQRRPKKDGPLINEDITANKVRLIDQDGEMRGIVSRSEALNIAADAGLDLLQVGGGGESDTPVCKVIDYGKFRYEQQKKASIAKKKQKIIELKELKLRPMIEEHDYQVKMRNAQKFLSKGDKVKFSMWFRGREMAHQDLGMEVLQRIKSELEETTKVEMQPKLEGRRMTMILIPLTT